MCVGKVTLDSFLAEAFPFLALATGFFLIPSPLGAIGPGSPYHNSVDDRCHC